MKGKYFFAFSFAMLIAAAGFKVQAANEISRPSGKELFQANCASCHNEKGFGTRILARRVPEGQATLEARKKLSASFVKMVVRRGIGSMPQIRKAELGDQDLDAIAKYLEDGV